MRCKRVAGILTVMLLVASLFPSISRADSPEGGKPGPGDAAPLFAVEDLDGKKVALEEILKSGKAVLLNFWGLRCGSCIEEIGSLNPIFDRYAGKGVVFLGVNVDGVKADVIRTMMPKMPNSPRYTVLPDPGFKIPDLYNMSAAPLSIVIGTDGKVTFRHEDFKEGDEKALEEALRKVIPGSR